MASQQRTVDFIVEQMGPVSAKRMFGEYGIFLGERMIALVCDDRLFIKPTPGGRAHVGEVAEAAPYPGAKPCLLIPDERWDDGDWLAELARITAAELPAPGRKPKRKPG